KGVGVLTGGRLTVEDAYAYGKFARVALQTNDIDFRARPHSAEELAFLASTVVGTSPESGAVTHDAVGAAPAGVCVAFEAEAAAPSARRRSWSGGCARRTAPGGPRCSTLDSGRARRSPRAWGRCCPARPVVRPPRS